MHERVSAQRHLIVSLECLSIERSILVIFVQQLDHSAAVDKKQNVRILKGKGEELPRDSSNYLSDTQYPLPFVILGYHN